MLPSGSTASALALVCGPGGMHVSSSLHDGEGIEKSRWLFLSRLGEYDEETAAGAGSHLLAEGTSPDRNSFGKRKLDLSEGRKNGQHARRREPQTAHPYSRE